MSSSPTGSDPQVNSIPDSDDLLMNLLLGEEPDITCKICMDVYHQPLQLECLHTFCRKCLLDVPRAQEEQQQQYKQQPYQQQQLYEPQYQQQLQQYHQFQQQQGTLGKYPQQGTTGNSAQPIVCPTCNHPTNAGVAALKPATNLAAHIGCLPDKKKCQSCNGGSLQSITAFCHKCPGFLCGRCQKNHENMEFFKDHHLVRNVEEFTRDRIRTAYLTCSRHQTMPEKYYCRTCSMAMCQNCLEDHRNHGELPCYIDDEAEQSMENMGKMAQSLKDKAQEMSNYLRDVGILNKALEEEFASDHERMVQNYQRVLAQLNQQLNVQRRELDEAHQEKRKWLHDSQQRLKISLCQVNAVLQHVNNLGYASSVDIIAAKTGVEERYQTLMNYMPEMPAPQQFRVSFVADHNLMNRLLGGPLGRIITGPSHYTPPSAPLRSQLEYHNGGSLPLNDSAPVNPRYVESINNPFHLFGNDDNHYTQWSNGTDNIEHFQASSNFEVGQDSISKSSSTPLRSQVRRTKMTYALRFGEYGAGPCQFTEPSGVAVNRSNQIVVADTNNHRIQGFDTSGNQVFVFGEAGKRETQLLYPNRVFVMPESQNIVVTERSPTHQVQIYDRHGNFIRRFGANILQHPRGVCVDRQNNIIIVECKVMRVIIFDEFGQVLNKFGCSKFLHFPNSVAVNNKREIFISDNRAHCVKVFNYQGEYLRQIGREGWTNFPIGVGIDELGRVVVADNHNNFNITIFSQDGSFIAAYESKVKHAQCYDVALMNGNSVVLASKDYKIYVYRWPQE